MLTLALLMLVSPWVSAQTPAPALGQAWPEVVSALQREGVQKIGDLDLAQFSKDAQKINWKKNLQAAPSLVAGARTSAYYVIDKKEVYISDNLPKDALKSYPDLELHEALGALGYEDNQYALSTSLRVILETKSSAERQILLKNFGKTIFTEDNMKIRLDGGSSVGGGGDIRTLLIKNQVLSEILNSSRKVSVEFYVSYPLINFEPIAKTDVDYVALNYKYRKTTVTTSGGALARVPIRNGYQELITVYVPMTRWQKPDQRPALITEIKGKILGLFPADAAATATVRLAICEKAQTMLFPATDDSSVRAVQTVRGGLLKGCDGLGDFWNEVWAPRLPEEAVPPAAGFYYYQCSFTMGTANKTQAIAIHENNPVRQMLQVDLTDTTRAVSISEFDGKGGIGRMYFVFFVNDKMGKPTAIKNISSLKDAFITTDFEGETLRFGCVRSK